MQGKIPWIDGVRPAQWRVKHRRARLLPEWVIASGCVTLFMRGKKYGVYLGSNSTYT